MLLQVLAALTTSRIRKVSRARSVWRYKSAMKRKIPTKMHARSELKIFDIVGKYVCASLKGCSGLGGPHQPERAARAGAESHSRMIASCPDHIRNIIPDRF